MQVPQMRTINENAALFGLPRHFIRQAVLDGRVVHVTSGRKYLINVDRFADWLNHGENINNAQNVDPFNPIRRVAE